MTALFHVSERDDIDVFTSRLAPGTSDPVVWAIDDAHLPNYLFPRDCPRICFYALPSTFEADIERHLGVKRGLHVVAIEETWLERCRMAELSIYQFESMGFECRDAGAGYFVSRKPVRPVGRRRLKNPVEELMARGVEIRVAESLWPIQDAIVNSTLQFSCIRMRNARPRERGVEQNRVPT